MPFGNKTAQHRENRKTYHFKSQDAYVNESHKNVVQKVHQNNPSRTRVRTCIKDYGTSNRQRVKNRLKHTSELRHFLMIIKQDFYAVDLGFSLC